MKLSTAGRDRIKGYEGYARALPDGSCTAYQETFHGKLDVPTIGWGCTEGVTMGMVWTKDQAEAALTVELEKIEAGVTRAVTVEINQNEFDALCALTYNIGVGALGRSTVLRKLNAGDRIGAADAFSQFNRSCGGVVPGLISRRSSEAGLFLRAPDGAPMPQSIDAPSKQLTTGQKIAAAATAGGAVVQSIPTLPTPPTAAIEALTAWQSAAGTLKSFGAFVVADFKLVACILAAGAAAWFWSKRSEAK
jgi:lysozyme